MADTAHTGTVYFVVRRVLQLPLFIIMSLVAQEFLSEWLRMQFFKGLLAVRRMLGTDLR